MTRDFKWTDEIKAQARKLYLDEGQSAEAVCRAIGAPSRSAVIGMLARMGVRRGQAVGQDTAAAQARIRARPERPRRPPAPKAAREKPQPSVTPPPLDEIAPSGGVVTPFRSQRSTAPELACTLAHLNLATACKWPISPPEVPGADMLFCAAPREAGSIYCPHHRALGGARQRSAAEQAADQARREAARQRFAQAGRERRSA